MITLARISWTDQRIAVVGRGVMRVRVGRVIRQALGPHAARRAVDPWGRLRAVLNRELAR
jgi:hypothetical protein